MARSSTSFKPGNTAALGNDKTLSISGHLKNSLEKLRTVEGYSEAMETQKVMADDMVEQYFKAQTPLEKKQVFETIANRVEGTPVQSVKHSGDSENPVIFSELPEEKLLEMLNRAKE